MRLLHTSDWHLGHTLRDFSRQVEHDRFLAWLIDLLVAERADALIIAGDVFDNANPPASAQQTWFRFLATARDRCPELDIVVIGGNHDSAARLDAPNPILDALRVHVVGGLGGGDERLVVPLTDCDGQVAAWVACVPYLRVADLPRTHRPGVDALVEGVREVYDRALSRARSLRQPGQALVATGHCYLVGTRLSEQSERKLLGGNQHPLPIDVFPDDLAYVALGHLHLAQHVGHDRVRYSGSPIPLSLGERTYPHQVVMVELTGDQATDLRSIRVPRAVEIVRIPATGSCTLDQALQQVRELPDADLSDPATHPYLEISLRLDHPEPGLRQVFDEALDGRAARLARLGTTYPGTDSALGEVATASLNELALEEVLLHRWHRDFEEPPPAELLAAFHDLVEQVHRGVDQ